jgi:hypothetical protein
VVLPAPSAGDVTYGVAQVRIGHTPPPPAAVPGRTGFATRVGGLEIVARSSQWRALRATTRVFVVVSRVRGAGASVRDIAFFIVRRSGRGPARASIGFTIGNAVPVIGSYWVRGVDRSGLARVFRVRDVLATAVANWSRYVGALKVADALVAAMQPRNLHPQTRAIAAAGAGAGPWTGGQRPSALDLRMYHLIFGALREPAMYGAIKRDPLVADFIANELHNPKLAERWRRVVTSVPSAVPDRYAAAAQEERRFERVTPPRLARDAVTIADGQNSSEQAGNELELTPSKPYTLTVVRGGSGSGTVTSYAHRVDCGSACSETFHWPEEVESLTAVADSGSRFVGWRGAGCDTPEPGVCYLEGLNRDTRITAVFATTSTTTEATPTLTAALAGSGSGTVISTPAGITCGGACAATFPSGQSVTLTATPASDSRFMGSIGCDADSGPTCTVTITNSRTVSASFARLYALTVINRSIYFDQTGTITSVPAGISCGRTCVARFPSGTSVTLTAAPDAGSYFFGWGQYDCDSRADFGGCVVTMTRDRTVEGDFGYP